jgi:hypothetical protein
MPWFPEFYSAVELSRKQTRAAGLHDPVGQYFAALNTGDTRDLETVWPGKVVVYDPRAGEVRGHRQLRRFVQRNQAWLAQRNAQTTTVAATRVGGRAVVELLVHLDGDKNGQHDDVGGEGSGSEGEVAWPVAVVAESPDDLSIVFRTYCSQWPVDGRRYVRPPILDAGQSSPGDVVGRYQAALEAGDADAAVSTFAPNGYYREPIGLHAAHRGTDELRKFFAWRFSAGGGIGLQYCAMTDDGVRCALEYNCIRWGRHQLPAQAGLGVYERGPDGLLAAVRVYDDIEAPVGAPGDSEAH